MGLPHPSRGIVRLDPCTAARAGAAILVCPTALEDEHEPSARLCGDGDLASVSFVLLRKFARSSSKNFVDWTLPAPKQCSGPPQTMFRHLPHAAPLLQDRRVVRSRCSRRSWALDRRVHVHTAAAISTLAERSPPSLQGHTFRMWCRVMCKCEARGTSSTPSGLFQDAVSRVWPPQATASLEDRGRSRRNPVPHQKKFKKTKSCWGPLFIVLIKRAGSRFYQLGTAFHHLV